MQLSPHHIDQISVEGHLVVELHKASHPVLHTVRVTDAGVVPLLQSSPQLTMLSLYWNLNVSDAVLTAAASSCPALRSVNVSGCKRINDVGVAALAAACPQLTELDLTRCQVCAVPVARPQLPTPSNTACD